MPIHFSIRNSENVKEGDPRFDEQQAVFAFLGSLKGEDEKLWKEVASQPQPPFCSSGDPWIDDMHRYEMIRGDFDDLKEARRPGGLPTHGRAAEPSPDIEQ